MPVGVDVSGIPFQRVTETIDQIHKEISATAAKIANADERTRQVAPGLEGAVFREASARSTRGGLAIELMPGLDTMLSETQLETLRQIGQESMHAAILEEKDLFVGAILGEVREGRSYFNRFVDYDNQMTLF